MTKRISRHRSSTPDSMQNRRSRMRSSYWVLQNRQAARRSELRHEKLRSLYRRWRMAHPNIAGTTLDNKIGRNAPCPCGSGKKYKKCCMGKMAN
ncbi:MAG: SEC-C metal-binding domain-containing protein [Pseudomonadota bacterium]